MLWINSIYNNRAVELQLTIQSLTRLYLCCFYIWLYCECNVIQNLQITMYTVLPLTHSYDSSSAVSEWTCLQEEELTESPLQALWLNLPDSCWGGVTGNIIGNVPEPSCHSRGDEWVLTESHVGGTGSRSQPHRPNSLAMLELFIPTSSYLHPSDSREPFTLLINKKVNKLGAHFSSFLVSIQCQRNWFSKGNGNSYKDAVIFST